MYLLLTRFFGSGPTSLDGRRIGARSCCASAKLLHLSYDCVKWKSSYAIRVQVVRARYLPVSPKLICIERVITVVCAQHDVPLMSPAARNANGMTINQLKLIGD